MILFNVFDGRACVVCTTEAERPQVRALRRKFNAVAELRAAEASMSVGELINPARVAALAAIFALDEATPVDETAPADHVAARPAEMLIEGGQAVLRHYWRDALDVPIDAADWRDIYRTALTTPQKDAFKALMAAALVEGPDQTDPGDEGSAKYAAAMAIRSDLPKAAAEVQSWLEILNEGPIPTGVRDALRAAWRAKVISS